MGQRTSAPINEQNFFHKFLITAITNCALDSSCRPMGRKKKSANQEQQNLDAEKVYELQHSTWELRKVPALPSCEGGKDEVAKTAENCTKTFLPRIHRNSNANQNSVNDQSSNRYDSKIRRPKTATLPSPKILNPDFIQHDMSLTRLDFSTVTTLPKTEDSFNRNVNISKAKHVPFNLPNVTNQEIISGESGENPLHLPSNHTKSNLEAHNFRGNCDTVGAATTKVRNLENLVVCPMQNCPLTYTTVSADIETNNGARKHSSRHALGENGKSLSNLPPSRIPVPIQISSSQINFPVTCHLQYIGKSSEQSDSQQQLSDAQQENTLKMIIESFPSLVHEGHLDIRGNRDFEAKRTKNKIIYNADAKPFCKPPITNQETPAVSWQGVSQINTNNNVVLNQQIALSHGRFNLDKSSDTQEKIGSPEIKNAAATIDNQYDNSPSVNNSASTSTKEEEIIKSDCEIFHSAASGNLDDFSREEVKSAENKISISSSSTTTSTESHSTVMETLKSIVRSFVPMCNSSSSRDTVNSVDSDNPEIENEDSSIKEDDKISTDETGVSECLDTDSETISCPVSSPDINGNEIDMSQGSAVAEETKCKLHELVKPANPICPNSIENINQTCDKLAATTEPIYSETCNYFSNSLANAELTQLSSGRLSILGTGSESDDEDDSSFNESHNHNHNYFLSSNWFLSRRKLYKKRKDRVLPLRPRNPMYPDAVIKTTGAESINPRVPCSLENSEQNQDVVTNLDQNHLKFTSFPHKLEQNDILPVKDKDPSRPNSSKRTDTRHISKSDMSQHRRPKSSKTTNKIFNQLLHSLYRLQKLQEEEKQCNDRGTMFATTRFNDRPRTSYVDNGNNGRISGCSEARVNSSNSFIVKEKKVPKFFSRCTTATTKCNRPLTPLPSKTPNVSNINSQQTLLNVKISQGTQTRKSRLCGSAMAPGAASESASAVPNNDSVPVTPRCMLPEKRPSTTVQRINITFHYVHDE